MGSWLSFVFFPTVLHCDFVGWQGSTFGSTAYRALPGPAPWIIAGERAPTARACYPAGARAVGLKCRGTLPAYALASPLCFSCAAERAGPRSILTVSPAGWCQHWRGQSQGGVRRAGAALAAVPHRPEENVGYAFFEAEEWSKLQPFFPPRRETRRLRPHTSADGSPVD